MKSDLKNLAAEQEIYYSDPSNDYQYAPSLTALDFAPSSGVSISLSATAAGWEATATHQALGATEPVLRVLLGCATVSPPASVTGVVACTGE